jgi:hypothetical protein
LNSNKYIGCYYREYAMGWGKTRVRGRGNRNDSQGEPDVPGQVPNDFSQQDFWRWVRQHTAWDIVNGATNPLASAYASQAQIRWSGRGMPAYVEVPAQRASHAARFVVSLRQPAPLLSTTDARSTVAAPIGRFLYRGLQAHEHVAAKSAAEVYFERPIARPDGRTEIATLFRPYWQARLTAVPASYRRRERP